MADLAKLVLEIDSDGVVTGKVRLDQLTEAGKKSEDQNKKHKVSFTELNSAVELAAKAFNAAKAASGELTREFLSGEASSNKLTAVLRAVGDEAGVTADQLEGMAYRLSGLTQVDDDQIKAAEALGLTYERLRGNALEPTLEVALDMAQLFDGSVTSSMQALGKTAEMGADGLTVLKRSGVALSEEIEGNIRKMYEAGDATEAWSATLDALRAKVGGTAQQMGSGDAGNVVRFQNAIDNLQESMGRLAASDLSPLIRQMTELFDTMSGSRVSLFFGEFLDAKDKSGAVSGLSMTQLIDLQNQIDKIQAGDGFFGGKAGWFEKLAEGELNRLESAILGRLNELKKAQSLAEKVVPKTSSSGTPTGAVPNFAALTGLVSDQESVLVFSDFLDKLSEAPQDAYDLGLALGKGLLADNSPMSPVKDNGEFYSLSKPKTVEDKLMDGSVKWSERTAGIAEFREALGSTIDEATRLYDTFEKIGATMQDIAAQGIANGFEDIGAALATGADAGEAFGQAMLRMGVQMAEQVGQQMVTLGLQLLIKSGGVDPLGWAFLAAGGGIAMAGGAVGAATSDSSARSSSRSVTPSPSPAYSSSPISVSLINQSGVQVEAQARETQTPSGTRQLMLVLKPMVSGIIASGGADQAMTNRFGVAPLGRSRT